MAALVRFGRLFSVTQEEAWFIRLLFTHNVFTFSCNAHGCYIRIGDECWQRERASWSWDRRADGIVLMVDEMLLRRAELNRELALWGVLSCAELSRVQPS